MLTDPKMRLTSSFFQNVCAELLKRYMLLGCCIIASLSKFWMLNRELEWSVFEIIKFFSDNFEGETVF